MEATCAKKESTVPLMLGTYSANLKEFENQIERIRLYNNRMNGPVPMGESGPDEVAAPMTTVGQLDELNNTFRELIAKLASEAARLEEIG